MKTEETKKNIVIHAVIGNNNQLNDVKSETNFLQNEELLRLRHEKDMLISYLARALNQIKIKDRIIKQLL